MSTTAPPNIDELKGDELDQAISDAGIDASTGGSRADGSLSADEKRQALRDHYDSSQDAPSSDEEVYDGEKARESESTAGPSKDGRGATGRASADEASAENGDDVTPNAENPNAPDPEPSDSKPSVDEQRERQLEAGKVTGAAKAAADAVARQTAAEQRAGYSGARPTEGRVDNMTRRSDADVLQGHFCTIDFSDPEYGEEARKAVEAVVGEGNARSGAADYGVYTDPGMLDEDGYPITATVLLRDEHAALVSSVPYGALRPAAAGGRR